MRIRLILITLSIVAAAFARPGIARAADPYEIDALLPQSGNGAFLGQAQEVALKLAAASPGGR
jgi:hypothetical protein